MKQVKCNVHGHLFSGCACKSVRGPLRGIPTGSNVTKDPKCALKFFQIQSRLLWIHPLLDCGDLLEAGCHLNRFSCMYRESLTQLQLHKAPASVSTFPGMLFHHKVTCIAQQYVALAYKPGWRESKYVMQNLLRAVCPINIVIFSNQSVSAGIQSKIVK